MVAREQCCPPQMGYRRLLACMLLPCVRPNTRWVLHERQFDFLGSAHCVVLCGLHGGSVFHSGHVVSNVLFSERRPDVAALADTVSCLRSWGCCR